MEQRYIGFHLPFWGSPVLKFVQIIGLNMKHVHNPFRISDDVYQKQRWISYILSRMVVISTSGTPFIAILDIGLPSNNCFSVMYFSKGDWARSYNTWITKLEYLSGMDSIWYRRTNNSGCNSGYNWCRSSTTRSTRYWSYTRSGWR